MRIYASKGKLLLFLLASLTLAVAAIYFVGEADDTATKAGLIAAVPFAGLVFVFVLVKLIGDKPSLELDIHGLTDRSSFMSGGRLRWDQVRDVHVHVLNGRRFLGIEPVDRGAYLAGEGMIRKAVRALTRSKLKDFPVIAIPAVTVSMPLDALVAEMQRFHPGLMVLPEQTSTTA